MKTRLLLVLALVIGSCIVAQAAEPTLNSPQPVIVPAVEATKPNTSSTPYQFPGKLVRVQMTGGTRNEVFVLENVTLTPLNPMNGSEWFIFGTGIKNGPRLTSWCEGLEVHLNLRLVASYCPMTPEQWKAQQRFSPTPPAGPISTPPQPAVPQPIVLPPPAVAPTSGIAPRLDATDLKAAREERVKLLTQVVEILTSQYQSGTTEITQVTTAENELYNALLDSTDAREKEKYSEKVLGILGEKIEDLESNPKVWMETFAVRMAGEMRLEPAIPLIITKLKERGEEAKWLNELCESALVKIGGDATIQAVADLYRQGDWHLRMAACNVLEHIHSDLAVTTALGFLPTEEDGTIRAFLAGGLPSHFAFEAIEPLRQMVIDGNYDETDADLKRDVVIAAKLMGVAFPELEQWKLEVEEKRLEIETRLLEQDTQRLLLEQERLARELREVKAKEQSLRRQLAEKQSQQEPTSKKIGRNDPCPCGSGKKFKKCCIRKYSSD